MNAAGSHAEVGVVIMEAHSVLPAKGELGDSCHGMASKHPGRAAWLLNTFLPWAPIVVATAVCLVTSWRWPKRKSSQRREARESARPVSKQPAKRPGRTVLLAVRCPPRRERRRGGLMGFVTARFTSLLNLGVQSAVAATVTSFVGSGKQPDRVGRESACANMQN